MIESGFKTNALSKASARGPWQFMRATATEQGLKTDWYVDERSDPEKATIAAARYLKTLFNMFDGDWHLVLAAYNGGLGRVQRAMKRSGREDFWSLSDSTRYLPRETREYVPLILAAIIVSKNPSQYGFDITAQDPIRYEKVLVPKAIDLRRAAEWTGRSIDEIQALNPELRRWTTPLKSEYELKVPDGTATLFKERLASASPDELVALTWYTVKKGETIATISRKLKVSRVDLAEANNLSTKSKIRPGQDAGGPAGASDAPRHQQPTGGAGGGGLAQSLRCRADGRRRTPSARRGAAGRQGRRQLCQDRHLPRQARRHALRDRPALRHHGGQDQEPEPVAIEPNHAGHAPEDRLGQLNPSWRQLGGICAAPTRGV